MVQPLPGEQMLLENHFHLQDLTSREQTHEPFMLPSPQPPPLSQLCPALAMARATVFFQCQSMQKQV